MWCIASNTLRQKDVENENVVIAEGTPLRSYNRVGAYDRHESQIHTSNAHFSVLEIFHALYYV